MTDDFSLYDPIWRRPPFEHQTEIARFHYLSKNTLDASEVGVGKTAPAIVALQRLFLEEKIHSALIIAPNSILDNWAAELRINSSLSFTMLRGTKEKRIDLIHGEPRSDLYLINYEAVRTVVDHLQWLDCDLILCDEIHHIKSFSSQQTKHILALGKMARARKGMTGTLLTNDIMDLWAIAQFIDPKIFKTNYWGYRNRYMFDANAGKKWLKFPDWQPRDGAVEEVQRILEPHCIRFEKRQVLKFLPPVLFEKRYVDLGGEQQRAYNELKRHFITELKDGIPLVAPQILGRVMKLLEIASGFAYREDKTYQFEENAKLKELNKVRYELGNSQAIIFCTFTEDIKILMHELGGNAEAIHGEIKAPDRQSIVDRFNRGEFRYLVGNAACMGEGYTILAPYAIDFSRGYKLGEHIQKLGRFDRPGAEKFDNLTVIQIIARGTVDEQVIAALDGKEDLLKAVNPKRWEGMLQ